MKSSQLGFIPIITIVVILVLSLGAGGYMYLEKNTADHSEVTPSEQETVSPDESKAAPQLKGAAAQNSFGQPPKANDLGSRLLALEQELKNASRSGGISPSSYKRIAEDLAVLEIQGVPQEKIVSLRATLSSLSVGGAPKGSTSTGSTGQTPSAAPLPSQTDSAPSLAQPTIVRWDFEHPNGPWKPNGTPPQCPEFVFPSPVDIAKASSILYPGQIRGTSLADYKPHGGFRFDTYTGDVEARVVSDGFVWLGSRYYDGGVIQYMFDIVHECGVMHRYGHLLELSPKFQELAERMRPAVEKDSRTTDLRPYVFVKKGELIATKIGMPGYPGMDWGIFDLRKENSAAQDPVFREAHQLYRALEYHGLCWLDLLEDGAKTIAKSLPAGDGKMGKTSDYCK